jgi:serine/threonine protein kinase
VTAATTVATKATMATKAKAPVRQTVRDVAVKQLDLDKLHSPAELARVHSEVALTQRLNHPNLIRVLTSFTDGQVRHAFNLIDWL